MTNNGWSAVTEAAVTRVYVAGDVNGCTFRSGDVATVFTWLFEQIDTRVEHVTMLNGWRSVAENTKDGGDPGSNHLSGTAGDVNGFKHPYEHLLPVGQRYGNYHSGWTNSQIAEIRKILAEAGLFAWGLDYGSGWRDAMHFDLRSGTTAAQVRVFADKVAPPAITPEDEMFMIQDNRSTGPVALVDGGYYLMLNDASTAAFTEALGRGPKVVSHNAYTTIILCLRQADTNSVLGSVLDIEVLVKKYVDAKISETLAQATAAANKPGGVATVGPETVVEIATATRDEFTARPLK
jgi:hypothetical protein